MAVSVLTWEGERASWEPDIWSSIAFILHLFLSVWPQKKLLQAFVSAEQRQPVALARDFVPEAAAARGKHALERKTAPQAGATPGLNALRWLLRLMTEVTGTTSLLKFLSVLNNTL